jgi:hypothetical protein
MIRRLLPLLLLAIPALSPADESTRQKVDMPPPAASALREEMLMKLQALHKVEAALAAGNPAEAAPFAERHLGMGAMGQHAALPPEARPGRYLPEAMHSIGRQSHRIGSELAEALKAGDRPRIDAGLRDITATCVACHSSYRLH